MNDFKDYKNTYIGFKAHGFGFDAHLTVLYIGEQSPELVPHIREYLAETFRFSYPLRVLRESLDLFGPDRTIPVARVTVDNDMRSLRNSLERRFENASQFKDWNPHISLDISVAQDIKLPYIIELTDFGLY